MLFFKHSVIILYMNISLLPNSYLPKIRSVLTSNNYLSPYIWFEEIEKSNYHDILGVIEIYEFIIASLIKGISFINIQNESLLKKINDIYSNIEHYTNQYFNYNHDYVQFFKIIEFISFKLVIFERVNNKTDKISNYFDCWNNYYEFIFNRNNENIILNGIYSLSKDDDCYKYREKNENFTIQLNNIIIPNIDFKEIYNLLIFFDEKKNI